jgi:hypothetical protein
VAPNNETYTPSDVTVEMQPIAWGADSIRAIDDDRIVFTTVIEADKGTNVILYENDYFNECDQGYESGDPLRFQLYSYGWDAWFDTSFTLNCTEPWYSCDPIFRVDGLYLLEWMDGHTRLDIEIEARPLADEAPYTYKVGRAYPNPFNPTFQFEFTVAHEQAVVVTVHDMLGRQVMRRSVDALPLAEYAVRLDMNDQASGTYVVSVTGTNFFDNQTVVLLK